MRLESEPSRRQWHRSCSHSAGAVLFRPSGSVWSDTFNPPPYVEGGTVRPSLRLAGSLRLDIFNLPRGGAGVVPVPPWCPCTRGAVSTCSVSGRPGPVVPACDPFGAPVGVAPTSGPFSGPAGARAPGPGWSGRAMSQQLSPRSRFSKTSQGTMILPQGVRN